MVNVMVIADRSGSMMGTIDEARNAINELIKDQKKLKGKCKFTFIMFDNSYEVVIDKVDIKEVKKVGKEYSARGMTALNDAIGKGIAHLGKAKKAIVTIVTDGFENSSQEYTQSGIAKLIKEKRDEGWEFQFIGANMDAGLVAQDFNISRKMSKSIKSSAGGQSAGYAFASSNATSYRANNS